MTRRADKLREKARRLVEGVMKTEETLSAEFLQGVRADVHRLEMEAWELDELDQQNKRAAD